MKEFEEQNRSIEDEVILVLAQKHVMVKEKIMRILLTP